VAVKRSQRFKVVLTLAERQEQEAADRLGSYRQQLQGEQQQLATLRAYNQDYIRQIETRRTGLKGTDLISYRNFLQRLGDAEQEQIRKLEQMTRGLERLQQEWRQKYQYRQSIEELIQRLMQEEDSRLEKRLQKELDELAAQANLRQRHSP